MLPLPLCDRRIGKTAFLAAFDRRSKPNGRAPCVDIFDNVQTFQSADIIFERGH